MENGSLLGIATEHDVVKKAVAQRVDCTTCCVREIMTSSPDCIRAESGEEEGDGSERDTVRAEFERRALTMMRDGRNGLGYRHLPVVSGADGTTPTALLDILAVARR